MKLLLSFLIALLSLPVPAQEAYILTNGGEKIVIDAGEYSYDTGKKIKYYSGNAIFPKTIKTTEVKEIVDGASLYKVYALDDKKAKFHLYKVVATAPGQTLLVRFIEPPANASSGSPGAEYCIADANLAVLARGEIGTVSNKKRTAQETQAAETIMLHFGECAALVNTLGRATAPEQDGTEKQITHTIPMAFKAQKGILQCGQ